MIKKLFDKISGTKVVKYPGLDRLSLNVPNKWNVYETNRFGILSESQELDVACTVFQASDQSLEDFSLVKSEGVISKMPWYEPFQDRKELKIKQYPAHSSIYEGVWPEENETTTYFVYCIDLGGYFLTLTFTMLKRHFKCNQEHIKNILGSLEYK